jgi:hypothetical protein
MAETKNPGDDGNAIWRSNRRDGSEERNRLSTRRKDGALADEEIGAEGVKEYVGVSRVLTCKYSVLRRMIAMSRTRIWTLFDTTRRFFDDFHGGLSPSIFVTSIHAAEDRVATRYT